MEVVPGVEHTEPYKGCALSHRRCVELAKERQLPWVLVLEDDCEPTDASPSRFDTILKALWARRSEWDILNGGPSFVKREESSLVQKDPPLFLTKGQTTHFILVNGTAYDTILEKIPVENPPVIDLLYRETMRMFTTLPFLARQAKSFSNIQKRKMNYTTEMNNSEKVLTSLKGGRRTRKQGHRKSRYQRKSMRRHMRQGARKQQRGGEPQENGFILTRCVRKPEQNKMYIEAYKRIREHHPTLKIVIIDDNSDTSALQDYPMENVEIIQSEFPAAGEYLPYYYLLTRKLFKKAICMQDSMLLNTTIDFNRIIDYTFLYYFPKDSLHETAVQDMLKHLKRSDELLDLYKNKEWVGCWGSAIGITLEFLEKIQSELDILQLKTLIKDREYRCGLERVSGLCAQLLRPKASDHISFFGNHYDMDVMKYPDTANNYNYTKYEQDPTRIKDAILKLWNGR